MPQGTLTVEAVAGRMLPRPGRPSEFVGYRRAKEGERPDHEVPDGRSYVRLGTVEVPNDRYYRKALRRGDLRTPSAKKGSASKTKASE